MSDNKFDYTAPEVPKTPVNIGLVSKTDMDHCPLCLKKWVIVEEEGKTGKAYFVCLPCMISIWVNDPLIGQYFRTEPVECPICNHSKTRVFYRSDGYLKYYCPKCKAIIESVDEVKHNKVLAEEVKKGVRWMPKPPEIQSS